MKPGLRWVVGSVIGAVVGAGVIVPKMGEPTFRSAEDRRAESAYAAWTVASGELFAIRQVLARADARAFALTLPPVRAESPLVRIDTRLPATAAAHVRDRLSDELREARADGPAYPIAVVVQMDTAARSATYQRAVVLPERDGEPCTIIIGVPTVIRTNFRLSSVHRLLGTCAFYAAHGLPGPAVQQWLFETRSAAAVHQRRPAAYASDTLPFRFENFTRFLSDDASDLVRCRLEDAPSCARVLVRDPTRSSLVDPMLRRTVATSGEYGRAELGTEVFATGGWMSEPRRIRAELLGRLEDDLGPERFGALWRDTRPLEESYAASVSRPITDWIREYVRSRTAPHSPGPGIPAVAVLAALLVTGLAFAFVALRSPRRMT